MGNEVHLEGMGEAESRSEGEVDLFAAQYFRDVSARDVHALGERGLTEAEFTHPNENGAEILGADVVEGVHFSKVKVKGEK